MRRWASGLLLACWSIAAGLSVGQPSDPAVPDGWTANRQVLHADDLIQAGAVRLSDVFVLLDDWYALSIDGFTWRAAPDGLAPTHQARWLLFVDGHRLDLTVFDEQNLNLAPVPISQVDSVVVHRAPTVVGGRLAQAGVLHFYTHRPDELTAQAGMMVGNEIDDPGPYSFTDRATRNVDRVGPGVVAALGYGGGSAGLRATVLQDYQHVTKRPQWDRVFGIYGRPHPLNRVRLQMIGVTAHLDRTRSRHRLLAGYSRFRDYRFLDLLGFEIATDRRTPHAGLTGTLYLGPATVLTYDLGYVRTQLGEWKNRVSHTFAWTQDRGQGHLAVSHQRGRLRLTTGLSGDLHRSHTEALPALDEAIIRTWRVAQQAALQVGPGWHQQLAVVASRTEQTYGLETLAATTLRLPRRQTLHLTAAYASQPPADANSLIYWLLQGYTVPWQERIDLTLPAALSRRHTTTLDAAWQVRLPYQIMLEARGGARWFRGGTDAAIDFGYVHPDRILLDHIPGVATIRTDLGGRVLRGGVTVRHRAGAGVRQRLHYAYQTVAEGDATFTDAWGRQPAHRLHYTLGYAPFPRFSLHGRLRIHSPTTWPGYARAEQATDGYYRTHLPAFALVDLAVHKAFWREHLDVTLSLRNALNAPYRPHPAAPETRLTFFAQVIARL